MGRTLAVALVASLLLGNGVSLAATPAARSARATTTGPCDTVGTPTASVYLPNITKTLGGPKGWVTPFYVQNAGGVDTTVEISFFRFSDGAFVTCRKTSGLAAGASLHDDPNADTDLPGDTQFSVVIRAFGAPVVAAVYQMQTTAGGAVQALSYSGFTNGSTTVYVPNVTRRFYGYDVPLIVQNLGTATASVTATFTDFANTQVVPIPLSIAAGRSAVIDPDYTAGLVDGTQYAVKLVSSQPIGVVANAHNETVGPVAFSHNGIATGATMLYAPYASRAGRVDIAGGYYLVRTDSPTVVQNVGTMATTATLTFTPLPEFSSDPPKTFTLENIPAGGSRAFDPRFPNGVALPNTPACFTASASCLGIGHYSLTVTATEPVAAVVLPNAQTTATGYLAAAAPTSRVVLPLVQRSTSSWNTILYLQSVTATSATLRFYSLETGALVVTKSMGLSGGRSVRINPVLVTGLAEGGRYSVVISGNGTLTAIADEYNFYTAGDGDMIYEGFAVEPSSAFP